MNGKNTHIPRCAIITAGARRIGAAIVKILHQQGFKVGIHCHQSTEEAQRLSNELNELRPDSAHFFIADLETLTDKSILVDEVVAWSGRLDLLVNNASLFLHNDKFDSNNWDAQFAVNTRAPYILSQLARSYLEKTTGSIINITDTNSFNPVKGRVIYYQTKAALHAQTLALANEFAPEIRVNAIAPGAIIWPEGENELNDEQKEKIISKTLLNKSGDPKCIAQAVLALVENEFITGQILKVDGGRNI